MNDRPELGTTRAVRGDGSSPYGRPIIKEPIWKPEIPFYFYTGGLAGASGVLAGTCNSLAVITPSLRPS